MTEFERMLEKYKRDSENYIDERLVKISNHLKVGRFYNSLREIDYRLSTLERKNNLYNIAELELDYSTRSCDYPTVHNILNNVYQRLATLEFIYKLRTIEFSLSEVISHASIISYEKDMEKNIDSLLPIKERIVDVEKKAPLISLTVNQYKPTVVPQQKPNKTIIAPKLQNDIIDNVVKKLSKEESWAANISVYGELLKQKVLEYDTVLESKKDHGHIYTQYRNENLLEEQKREIIFEERKKLLKSKCNACNRIPDNFGRCGCS